MQYMSDSTCRLLGTEAVARGMDHAHVDSLSRLSMLMMVAYTNTVNIGVYMSVARD